MKTSESIGHISAALVKFQAEVTNPKFNAVNPMYKSNYSTLDQIINTVKPVLAKYGLAMLQNSKTSEDYLHVGTSTILIHESGEFIEFDTLWLPAYKLGKGGEKVYDAQACGIASTYSRRYSASAALNISSEADDDANGIVHTSSAQPSNKPQTQSYNAKADDKRIKVIFAKISTLGKVPGKTVDGVKKKLAETMGVPSLDNFTPQQITQAIDILSGWEAAVKEKAGA